LEIDKKLICHTERYDPVVFTAKALHLVKLHQPDRKLFQRCTDEIENLLLRF
jgi:hypothetical protein